MSFGDLKAKTQDNSQQLTADEVLWKWKSEHMEIKKNDVITFYSSSYWPEAIDDLVFMMVSNGIPKDDAWCMSIQNKVVDFLVTKDGKKAAGKKNDKRHSWVPNMIEYFNAKMSESYVPNSEREYVEPEKNTNQSSNNYKTVKNTEYILPEDPVINLWVEKNYTHSEGIAGQVRDPMSFLFLEFMEDTFGKYLNNEESA